MNKIILLCAFQGIIHAQDAQKQSISSTENQNLILLQLSKERRREQLEASMIQNETPQAETAAPIKKSN